MTMTDAGRFLKVYMDLTNKCNLRCKMCYFSSPVADIPPENMSLDLFRKISDDVFPRALSVNLSCAAEPLILTGISEYLEILSRYNVPETLLVTNGLLLTLPIIEKLISCKITQIDISIDGAVRSTYDKIREGGDLDKLIANIEMLQSAKKGKNSSSPLLYLDYALMKSNVDELPDFMYLAKRLRADSVRVNHIIPFEMLHNKEESLVSDRKRTNELLDKSRKIAKKIGLNVCLPRNFDLSKKPNISVKFTRPECRVPFESLYIMSNGDAVPCVWFSSRKFFAGNFSRNSFDEIWNGHVFRDTRNRFEKKEFTRHCKNCPPYGDEPFDDYVFDNRDRSDISNIAASIDKKT